MFSSLFICCQGKKKKDNIMPGINGKYSFKKDGEVDFVINDSLVNNKKVKVLTFIKGKEKNIVSVNILNEKISNFKDIKFLKDYQPNNNWLLGNVSFLDKKGKNTIKYDFFSIEKDIILYDVLKKQKKEQIRYSKKVLGANIKGFDTKLKKGFFIIQSKHREVTAKSIYKL